MSIWTPLNAPGRTPPSPPRISRGHHRPPRESQKRDKPLKRITVRWDKLKRYVLCCLFRFFICDQSQTTRIFSHMFRSHLTERQFPNAAVGYDVLRGQFGWMKSKKHPDWLHVLDADFESGSEARDLIEQIQSAAAFLRIRLRPRRPVHFGSTGVQNGSRILPRADAAASSQVSSRSRRTRQSTPPTSEGTLPNTDAIGSPQTSSISQRILQFTLPTRARVIEHSVTLTVKSPYFPDPSITDQHSCFEDLTNGCHEPVVTSHGKVCAWCLKEMPNETSDKVPEISGPKIGSKDIEGIEDLDEVDDLEGLPTKDIPPLLYRFFGSNSQGANFESSGPYSEKGFVSGVFCREGPFSRDELSDGQLENYFINHVTKQKHATPFISTFRSPLAPMHRALKSTGVAYLAVIDTTKLNTQVFYAHPIAEKTGTFTDRWKGLGEYLIWGEAPRSAVVFVCPISEIERLSAQHTDICRLLLLKILRSSIYCDPNLRTRLAARRKGPYKSGLTFGKLLRLLHFPRLYWECAAQCFMACWGWCGTEDTVQFFRGLKSENEDGQELSDSESEETPFQRAVDKWRLTASSDIDYEPSVIRRDSEPSTITAEDMPESANASGVMENRTETADDGHFSTHESMSSFGLLGPSWRRARQPMNVTPMNVPSTDFVHRERPTNDGRFSVVIPRQVEARPAANVEDVEDLMVLDDDERWYAV